MPSVGSNPTPSAILSNQGATMQMYYPEYKVLALYSPVAEDALFGSLLSAGNYWEAPHPLFSLSEILKSPVQIEVGPATDPRLCPTKRYSYLSVNIGNRYRSDLGYDFHTGCVTPTNTLRWCLSDLVCAYLLVELVSKVPYLNYDRARLFVNISNQAYNRYVMCNQKDHWRAYDVCRFILKAQV